MDTVDFKHLELTGKPNSYLVCPVDYCDKTPQEYSQTYPVNVDSLKNSWEQMLKTEPRVKLTVSRPETNHYQYVQRSFLFRFPDYIDVEFIPLTSSSSTLAVYSRARYGYSDFGVNKKRVQNWLKKLASLVHR